jgi:hypothetical protein
MKPVSRTKLFGTASVTALVLLAGVMAIAHATGFTGPADCGPSGSPSVDVSGSGEPSGGPSTEPSPSGSPSAEPCPSGSPSESASESGPPDTRHGVLRGTLTTNAGGPLAFANVSALSVTSGPFHLYQSSTDGAGHYRIDGVAPGRYLVSFQLPGTSLTQYLHRKRTADVANLITVTGGQVTTADDRALATGTIAGHFRDRAGHPLAAQIVVSDPVHHVDGFARTDASGAYSVVVFTASYTVRFTYGSGTVQYAVGQIDPTKAKQFAVSTDKTTVVDETAVPSGSVTGKLIDNNGSPASGATVNLNGASNDEHLSTRTKTDGTYRFDFVPAGSYTVEEFSADFRRVQWAPHTVAERAATLVAVSAGQTRTVNDTFLATGTLKLTAKDPSGRAIASFCGTVHIGQSGPGACTTTGTATISGLPVGKYDVTVTTNTDTTLDTTVRDVAVPSTLATVIAPAGVIQTTTLDARTHQPVAGVCVVAVTLDGAQPARRGCADATGRVRIGRLANVAYTLVARPSDGVHGMQWVGSTGGTGSQYLARRTTPTPGRVTSVPAILLDPAGRVTGTVTDAATGKPVAMECVEVTPVGGDVTFPGACQGARSDSAGHYTLSGVGPYAWPVEFASADNAAYAWQWSGGVASRKQATLVHVSAGTGVTVNAKLVRGTKVSGTVLGTNGALLRTTVIVVNVDTGDRVGMAPAGIGSYAVGVLPQTVRMSFSDNRSPVRFVTDTGSVVVGTTPVTHNLTGL